MPVCLYACMPVCLFLFDCSPGGAKTTSINEERDRDRSRLDSIFSSKVPLLAQISDRMAGLLDCEKTSLFSRRDCGCRTGKKARRFQAVAFLRQKGHAAFKAKRLDYPLPPPLSGTVSRASSFRSQSVHDYAERF